MAGFEQKFGFEHSVVPVQLGCFRPVVDATKRWVYEYHPHACLGAFFKIVYQLNDGRYIHVEYGDCNERLVHRGEKVVGIWYAAAPSHGSDIPPEHVVALLVKWQLPIPDELAPHLSQVFPAERQKPAPRDLSYWHGKGLVECNSEIWAHTVRPLDQVKELVDLGIAAVQSIREWKPGRVASADNVVHLFGGWLFRRYKVDAAHWPSRTGIIPPKYVSLVELDWPAACDDILEAIEELQDLLEGPLSVLGIPLAAGHPDNPTMEERWAGSDALIERLPRLEALLAQLREELRVAGSEEKLRELQQQKGPLKAPSDKAIAAYRLSVMFGENQQAIAQALVPLVGIAPNQGTVSRWITRVKEWVAAGNILPEPKPIRRIDTVDPKVIDQGSNLEHRPPHQRHKKNQEDSSA